MIQRIQTFYLLLAALVSGVLIWVVEYFLNGEGNEFLFILGVYVYQSLMMSGETAVSEKGIGMFIPILSIVLIVLANKAIRKDEQLVKSADRLR